MWENVTITRNRVGAWWGLWSGKSRSWLGVMRMHNMAQNWLELVQHVSCGCYGTLSKTVFLTRLKKKMVWISNTMTLRVTVREKLSKRAVMKEQGSDRCIFNREGNHNRDLTRVTNKTWSETLTVTNVHVCQGLSPPTPSMPINTHWHPSTPIWGMGKQTRGIF